jgi:hypothetical protein
MLGQLDREDWEMVGDPVVHTSTDGPAICIIIRRERPS